MATVRSGSTGLASSCAVLCNSQRAKTQTWETDMWEHIVWVKLSQKPFQERVGGRGSFQFLHLVIQRICHGYYTFKWVVQNGILTKLLCDTYFTALLSVSSWKMLQWMHDCHIIRTVSVRHSNSSHTSAAVQSPTGFVGLPFKSKLKIKQHPDSN